MEGGDNILARFSCLTNKKKAIILHTFALNIRLLNFLCQRNILSPTDLINNIHRPNVFRLKVWAVGIVYIYLWDIWTAEELISVTIFDCQITCFPFVHTCSCTYLAKNNFYFKVSEFLCKDIIIFCIFMHAPYHSCSLLSLS